MSAYRTPAEVPVNIPPTRRIQARLFLAMLIVLPVRLVQWCWPWLVVNVSVNVVVFFGWIAHPKAMVLINLGLNALAAIGWGAYAAYRWARRELIYADKL